MPFPTAGPSGISSARRSGIPSSSFVLIAVPLFLLMGEILLRAGLSDRLYRTLNVWLSRVPGGLLHTNIASSAVFSAISGSSVATAATMGSVALPFFKGRAYDPKMVLGSLAAGGALGNLIPAGHHVHHLRPDHRDIGRRALQCRRWPEHSRRRPVHAGDPRQVPDRGAARPRCAALFDAREDDEPCRPRADGPPHLHCTRHDLWRPLRPDGIGGAGRRRLDRAGGTWRQAVLEDAQ